MESVDDREFDEWLHEADRALTASVADELDVPGVLEQVKREGEGPLLVKTDVVDLQLGSGVSTTKRRGLSTPQDRLALELKRKYEKGASIRALAEATGRSYGFVHRVLSESGVTLRGRGGARRTKKK